MPDSRAPLPHGFPDGFGEGPREADAVLVLRCLLGITPRDLFALIWRVGGASAACTAILQGSAGSDHDRAFLAGADPGAIRDRIGAAGARFAAPGDPEYWPAFLRLADPPVGIFVRGQPLADGHDRVALVGSRRPTPTGREVATHLARGLAAAGVVVVSGGAVGIDAAAHRGALDAGGSTVAVLGSGIDVDYPPSNGRLLRAVEQGGTIVGEYAPGVPAEPFRFPARNRLIAALSRGIVVVQGASRSGTRITAEHALELGLDVFAVPGSVTDPLAETPLDMIREGATMIRDADDLLLDLGIDPQRATDPDALPGLPAAQRSLLEALAAPMLPDAVARAAGVPVSDAISALVELELRGLVRGVGGRYERTFRAAPQRGSS
ncbi:MAG TPA: DNA-processing protein DprA [Actinomycetota bacterium]|nr:DNA-processing protein DprA [Actinomycetota bacterium]